MMPSSTTVAPTVPGGDAEQRRGEQHHQVERAAHRGEQVAERLEQALHQPGLVADVAHQDEHRHGDELVLLHQAEGLQVGEVEHRRAQADEAEDQREEQQREADRDADEDGEQHHQQHHRAERLEKVHSSIFSRCSNSRPKRIW
jgi:hypothetical protein